MLEGLLEDRIPLNPVDVIVLRATLYDLTGKNLRRKQEAVRFLLLDGKNVDENDQHTFQSICMRNNVNPDVIAQGLWLSLSPEKRREALDLYHHPLPKRKVVTGRYRRFSSARN
jgi:hypothetical protein